MEQSSDDIKAAYGLGICGSLRSLRRGFGRAVIDIIAAHDENRGFCTPPESI